MSYISKAGNGLMGFGDASSCGGNQAWDAGCNYNGIQGQCVPVGMVGKYSPCDYSKAAAAQQSSSSSIWGNLITGLTEVVKAKVTPAQVTNISTMSSPGMSTPTKLAIAGGAVVGGVLLIRALKK